MVLNNPESVFKAFGFLRKSVQEELYAIYLDEKLKVLGVYLVAKGSMNCAHFEPADVIRPALLIGASRIITVHNHPTGDPTPSFTDKEMMKRLMDACSLVGLSLVDNFVIGESRYERY